MKNTIKEHLWVIAGLIAAYIGTHVSIVLFSHHGFLHVGIYAVIIMSTVLAMLGFIIWLVSHKNEKKKSAMKINSPDDTGKTRVYKKHWIEIVTVLLVIIIFLGYLILHITSFGQFSSNQLNSIAFPAFIFCQILQLLIILRSQFLINIFLKAYPRINNTEALNKLKPVASQCMIMALFFIGLLLLSMLLAAAIFINWSNLNGIITALSLTTTSIVLKWYVPYEEQLKQIETSDPLLEPELNMILQSWQNNFLPKFDI